MYCEISGEPRECCSVEEHPQEGACLLAYDEDEQRLHGIMRIGHILETAPPGDVETAQGFLELLRSPLVEVD